MTQSRPVTPLPRIRSGGKAGWSLRCCGTASEPVCCGYVPIRKTISAGTRSWKIPS